MASTARCPHEHDAVDEANRAAFEECFRIVKRAWTEDLLSYEGRYWRIPPGATPWDLEATRRFGAGVVDGVVRAVAVVPKPLQQPHPPLFQPFASSERSIRWCAEEGVTAILPPLHPALEDQLVRLYADVSGKPLGDGIGVLRDVIVAPTDDEAMALWRDSGAFCGAAGSSPSGSPAGSPTRDRRAARPLRGGPRARRLARHRHAAARAPASPGFPSLALRLDLQRPRPACALMRSIELFWTEVLPRVAIPAG